MLGVQNEVKDKRKSQIYIFFPLPEMSYEAFQESVRRLAISHPAEKLLIRLLIFNQTVFEQLRLICMD